MRSNRTKTGAKYGWPQSPGTWSRFSKNRSRAILIEPRRGKSGIAMSTIDEVRAAEKKLQEVMATLNKTGAQYPDHLSTELKKATDDYARAVRELSST